MVSNRGAPAAPLLPATTFAQLRSSLEARTELFSATNAERWRGWSVLGTSVTFDQPRLSLTGDAALATDTEEIGPAGSLGASLISPVLEPLQLSATRIVRASRHA